MFHNGGGKGLWDEFAKFQLNHFCLTRAEMLNVEDSLCSEEYGMSLSLKSPMGDSYRTNPACTDDAGFTQCHKPIMSGDGKHTTHKNGDDLGVVTMALGLHHIRGNDIAILLLRRWLSCCICCQTGYTNENTGDVCICSHVAQTVSAKLHTYEQTLGVNSGGSL